jgi:hypothetical protein
MGAARELGLAMAGSFVLGGCLFPSLDGLSSNSLVTGDSGVPDVADGGALGCPDASDPTLEAYYRLDEGAGTVVTDCSSHGRNGAMVGAPGSWTTGKLGSALVVSSDDAGSGCVDIPTFPNITGALTVAAWVRVDKAPAPNLPGFIVDKSMNLNTEGWRMSTEASGGDFALTLGGIGDAGLDQFGSQKGFDLGSWMHVAVVVDPATHDAIYVNGVLDTTKSSPSATVASGADLRLGCRGDTSPTTFFDGALDEVRIYSRALAASEISALYTDP